MRHELRGIIQRAYRFRTRPAGIARQSAMAHLPREKRHWRTLAVARISIARKIASTGMAGKISEGRDDESWRNQPATLLTNTSAHDALERARETAAALPQVSARSAKREAHPHRDLHTRRSDDDRRDDARVRRFRLPVPRHSIGTPCFRRSDRATAAPPSAKPAARVHRIASGRPTFRTSTTGCRTTRDR
ncbi:hypothetical protein [Burkholderia multivorans]|uniref:hypothetical protein n=1 Tax=Burkholderia multivorans TaxID=87883 RepID=UPI0021ABA7C5|nr:hypothetical protein [Burkholderia multivorans]